MMTAIRASLFLSIALLALGSVGAQGQQTEGETGIVERCDTDEHRGFDFWEGTWIVRNAAGEVVGHNEIVRVAGGCGLLERWRGSSGGTGVSINSFDPIREIWTQRWVGSGSALWLEGGLRVGRMVLVGTVPRPTPEGDVLDRITWTPLPDGRVSQVWEVSHNGGANWTNIFEGLYEREDAHSGIGDDPLAAELPARG